MSKDNQVLHSCIIRQPGDNFNKCKLNEFGHYSTAQIKQNADKLEEEQKKHEKGTKW